MNSKEIEEQIKGFTLKFIQIRHPTVEWQMKFPMFIDTFNQLIQQKKRIPSQDEFVETYFQFNSKELSSVISDIKIKQALEARLRRTYPSLVRDVHFESLMKERGLSVLHERDTDVCEGVDHVVMYKETTFRIHCYVNTKIGREGRKIKNKRHDFHGIHLDVEMDLGGASAKRVGDFYLYSDDHIDYLIGMMDSELQQKD